VKSAIVGILSLGLLLSATTAYAEEPDEESAKGKAEDDTFGHFGQFGLRAGLLTGYRMIFRYDTSPYCREYDPMESEQPKSCGHGAPLASEFALSFALLDFLEPFAWVRLGLGGEEQTDTDPVQIIGVGTRIYTMSDSAFKIFVEPAIAYEFEGGGGNRDPQVPAGYDPDYSKDLILHLAIGPQYDFHQNVGVFLDGGITTGIFRGIHSMLELQLGVQGRFP
jgi:hypothetical protein